jgi:hypothetical protein
LLRILGNALIGLKTLAGAASQPSERRLGEVGTPSIVYTSVAERRCMDAARIWLYQRLSKNAPFPPAQSVGMSTTRF